MNNSNALSDKFLPNWVWAIAIIQVCLVLFFSIGTAINPGNFIPDVSELNYVTMLYITRNIVVAFGIIFALTLKSHHALLIILGVRLLTDMSDVITVYALNVEVIKASVPMVVILLIVPALFAICHLWKKIR